jgi:hypothetical protein
MREVIQDLIRQTTGLVEVISVEGTGEETTAKACDKDKTLFIQCKFKNVIPEFDGRFGIMNMPLLNGLLGFANYRADEATFTVKKRTAEGVNSVEQFEFKNTQTGNEATFRLMSPNLIPPQAVIPPIPWDVTIVPSKSKVSEFQQISGLMSEIDKNFGVRTVDGDLQFTIGASGSSHRTNMVFSESPVTGEIRPGLEWSTGQFLSVMKLVGNNPHTLSITNNGIISVIVETPFAEYCYFIRAKR